MHAAPLLTLGAPKWRQPAVLLLFAVSLQLLPDLAIVLEGVLRAGCPPATPMPTDYCSLHNLSLDAGHAGCLVGETITCTIVVSKMRAETRFQR